MIVPPNTTLSGIIILPELMPERSFVYAFVLCPRDAMLSSLSQVHQQWGAPLLMAGITIDS